jgi:hypothetical protein
MRCKKISRGFLLLLISFLFSTCDKSPTEPERFKDPRTYTWTIDTLAYPGSFQTMMRDIWGISPGDVYVVGHNDQNRGLMWHYDGAKWTDVKLSATQGGTILGPIDLIAVHGFSANDIWAVGEHLDRNPSPPPDYLDSSLLIHYNGAAWWEERLSGGRLLGCIGGDTRTNLWTAGRTKYLYQYDGAMWKRDSLPVLVPADGYFGVNAIAPKSAGEVYALGNTHQNSLAKDTYFFFRRTQLGWSMADSAIVEPGHIENKWGYSGLWVSPSGRVYSVGGGVFQLLGNNWERMIDSQKALLRISGTSDNNIFVVGSFGTVLHYNGVDWFQFMEIRYVDVNYWGIWTNGKEVMIVGHSVNYPQHTVVAHGR